MPPNDWLQRIEDKLDAIEARLPPLEKHVAMWAGVGKALAILSTAATLIGGIVTLLRHAP